MWPTIDQKDEENQLTRINISSENVWEASELVAKGGTWVVYTFSVGRGKLLDSILIRFFDF